MKEENELFSHRDADGEEGGQEWEEISFARGARTGLEDEVISMVRFQEI